MIKPLSMIVIYIYIFTENAYMVGTNHFGKYFEKRFRHNIFFFFKKNYYYCEKITF